MPKIEGWYSAPVENEIILTVIRNRGEILTTDLFRTISNEYQDFSRPDLLDYLFRLEVRGLIIVSQIKKEVLKVELNPKAHFSEEIFAQIKKSKE